MNDNVDGKGFVIGRRYVYLNNVVKLVEANAYGHRCTVETLNGVRSTCDVDELDEFVPERRVL